MLYSQRNRRSGSELIYSIPHEIRILILRALRDFTPQYRGGYYVLLDHLENAILKRTPRLSGALFDALRPEHSAEDHFFHCSEEEALDFIELCFQQYPYCGEQNGVDAVNAIFIENDIGFELTRYIVQPVEAANKVQFPHIIRRDANIVQQQVLEPALQLLSDPRLHVANNEMLNALTSLRDGDFENAITSATSAFESLMKTICHIKRWQYDQKATCARLVKILKDNQLFPSFYVQSFEGVGTIRNNLGDAHGRGPLGNNKVTREQAEHLVHTTSAHMLFLAKRAGL